MQSAVTSALTLGAFSVAAPGRLNRVVQFGRDLGRAGIQLSEASDAIEEALWGNGLLPLDRPSQRLAWDVARTQSLDAHREGAREWLAKLASDAVEDFGEEPYRAAYFLASVADRSLWADDELAEALETAFGGQIAIRAGRAWCPFRTARENIANGHFDLARELLEQSLALNWSQLARSTASDLPFGAMSSTIPPEPPVAALALVPANDRPLPPPSITQPLRWIDFDPNEDSRPPSWLVKNTVPRQGLGMLYGPSGAGKTFLAIHAALCVTHGLPFFGRRAKSGGVLYVAAEGGTSVKPRIRAAAKALAPAIAAANLSREKGAPPVKASTLRIVTEAPNLSRDGQPGPFVSTIRQAYADFETRGEQLAMIVVDTLHAAMGGGDENSAADMGAVLKPLRDAAEQYGVFVLILHHPGKDLDRGARGSNSLHAAVDTAIELRVPGNDGVHIPSDAMRRATAVKMRDGETGATFSYRLPVVNIGVDEDGDPWTTCVVQPFDEPKLDDQGLTKSDRQFMDCVRAAVDEAGGRAEARIVRARLNAALKDRKPDAQRQAWARGYRAAVDAGRICVDDLDAWIWLPA